MGSLLRLVLLLYHCQACFSHVCLLRPKQRGLLDISKPGSETCAYTISPCGGQGVETPQVSYNRGQQLLIKFQQNSNYYEPGFPGYMVVSLASSVKMDDLTTLAVVGDENFYQQEHSKNYTMLVVLPNIECPHCVIQLVYHSHRPGEKTFYQCADIQIKKSSPIFHNKPDFLHTRNENQLWDLHLKTKAFQATPTTGKLYGLSFNPLSPSHSQYVSVDVITGAITKLSTLPFGVANSLRPIPNSIKRKPRRHMHSPTVMPSFVLCPVAVHDKDRNVTIFIKHNEGMSLDEKAHQRYMIGTFNGSLVEYGSLIGWNGARIEFLDIVGNSNYIMTQINVSESGVNLIATWMMFDGEVLKEATVQVTPPYVHFLWSATNYLKYNGTMYVLMGNEHDPAFSDVMLYVLNFPSGTTRFVRLDCSQFTISSLLVYKKMGQLLAMSPGLYGNKYPAWSLVEINPITGHITPLMKVTLPGVFANYYGGTVLNGIDQSSGILYHVLRFANSPTDVIVNIDLQTHQVVFSGPTNLRHIFNLLYAKPEVFSNP